MRLFTLIIIICMTVAACGQKGPLYLPKPGQPPAKSKPLLNH
ncbi:MAG: lipoprotein [Tatlockia sp.]|nr:lipoprotein [Tatlockia sp.]